VIGANDVVNPAARTQILADLRHAVLTRTGQEVYVVKRGQGKAMPASSMRCSIRRQLRQVYGHAAAYLTHDARGGARLGHKHVAALNDIDRFT